MLNINCWVLGNDPKQVFSVEIAKTKTVDALKDAIKEKKKNMFDSIDAHIVIARQWHPLHPSPSCIPYLAVLLTSATTTPQPRRTMHLLLTFLNACLVSLRTRGNVGMPSSIYLDSTG